MIPQLLVMFGIKAILAFSSSREEKGDILSSMPLKRKVVIDEYVKQ